MDKYMSQPVALPGGAEGGVSVMVRAFFESLPEASCKIITLGEKAVESDETKVHVESAVCSVCGTGAKK